MYIYLQDFVSSFLNFVRSIVEAKKTNGAASDLVLKVVRSLSNQNMDNSGNELPYAVLHRGLVIAARIVAISTPPYCTQDDKEMMVSEKPSGSTCLHRKIKICSVLGNVRRR